MNVISIESTDDREDVNTGFVQTSTQTLYRAVSIYKNELTELTGENTICAVAPDQFAYEEECRRFIKSRYPDRVLVKREVLSKIAGEK